MESQPQALPATSKQPAKQPNGIENRSAPKKVSGKLKTAIDALIWDTGQHDLQSAAKQAGLTTYALRQALSKPHVLAYMKEQRQVLLSGERPRNIHAAISVRDQKDNQTARIQAVKLLEEMAQDQRQSSTSRVTQPGVVVVINTGTSPTVDDTVIELNPLSAIDNGQQGDD